MEIIRTTDVLVETKRKFIIRQPPNETQISCERCAAQMLTAESAAILFAVSRRIIYRLIERAAIHFVEIEAGAIFVCPSSLDAAIGNPDDAPPAEIVELSVAASAENRIGEIELRKKNI